MKVYLCYVTCMKLQCYIPIPYTFTHRRSLFTPIRPHRTSTMCDRRRNITYTFKVISLNSLFTSRYIQFQLTYERLLNQRQQVHCLSILHFNADSMPSPHHATLPRSEVFMAFLCILNSCIEYSWRRRYYTARRGYDRHLNVIRVCVCVYGSVLLWLPRGKRENKEKDLWLCVTLQTCFFFVVLKKHLTKSRHKYVLCCEHNLK